MLKPTLEEQRSLVEDGDSVKMVKDISDNPHEAFVISLSAAKQEVKPDEPKKPSASILLIRRAKELSDQGKSLPSIATEMGKDEAWVHASLLIANKLPEKAHQAISDGKFSRMAALQLLLADQNRLDKIIDGALVIADVEGKL
jgi:hypothetical protein